MMPETRPTFNDRDIDNDRPPNTFPPGLELGLAQVSKESK